MNRGRVAQVLAVLVLLGLFGCRRSHATEAAAPVPLAFKPLKITMPIFRGGVQDGWYDFGWVDHKEAPGQPAAMSFANYGGWILANGHLKGDFGGLRFSYKTPHPFGDFLEVRVDSTRADIFPRVRVKAAQRSERADGWTDVFVSIRDLNPHGASFDRVVIRSVGTVPDEPILFNDVGLTERDPSIPTATGRAPTEVGPAKSEKLAIDCRGQTHPINPLIYGIAYAPRKDAQDTQQWKIGATARRWGGNPASRYNWELGNAWNAGSDYFFYNLNYSGSDSYTYDNFLTDNLLRKVQAAVTVPILGWVAKDTRSVGFPVATFGRQQEIDDQNKGGNGLSPKGVKLEPGPPTLTSVEASPEFIARWVHAIREKDKKRGRTVSMYILDNEPALWNDTHRDIHPKPTTYDELVDRTIRYGTAVRKEDPDALIAGPAEWGWPAYFGSALDQETRNADRHAHGDVPMLAWYLRKVREYEKRSGLKILDVLDVHFYPQAKGLGQHESGKTDAATNALRLRTTRALWDPTYLDESWIAEKIELIPRLKRWIAQEAPGVGISIGEWNFGAEDNMNGGLTVAEVLGRFGDLGLTSAFYWTYPAADSPAAWAFRAYRNYDGHGAHFLDTSIPTRMTSDVSLYASKDANGKMVAVVLNLSPDKAVDAEVALEGCPAGTRVQRIFTYDGDPKGFVPSAKPTGAGLHLSRLNPSTMTVVELAPGGG